MFAQKLQDKIIVLIAHGSRLASANHDFEDLLRAYAQRWPGLKILHAYLELAQPSMEMETVLGKAALWAHKEKQGLIVAPLLLFPGTHFQRDIPQALHRLHKAHPQVPLYLSDVLGAHPNLSQLAYKRACQTALILSNSKLAKTALLYFGRGSKVKSSRNDFKKQSLLFKEGRDFASSWDCFAAMQKPSLEEALNMSVALPASPMPEQILIVPHLLFFGLLLENAQKQIAAFQTSYPQIAVGLAQPLGTDELLFAVLDERILNAQSVQHRA